jgi:hypothetical protein
MLFLIKGLEFQRALEPLYSFTKAYYAGNLEAWGSL